MAVNRIRRIPPTRRISNPHNMETRKVWTGKWHKPSQHTFLEVAQWILCWIASLFALASILSFCAAFQRALCAAHHDSRRGFASVFFKSLVLLFIQRGLEPQHFLTVAGLKDVLDPKSWSHSLYMYQFSPSRRKWRTLWHSQFFSLLHKFLYEHNSFILLLSNNCRCNFSTKMQSANCFIIYWEINYFPWP